MSQNTIPNSQAIYAIGIAQAIKQRDETARLAQLTIRDGNTMATERDLFRQLTSEALALLDENDPDHEQMDLRQWIRAARHALGRQP